MRDANRTVARIVASLLGDQLVYGTVMPWRSDRGPSGDAANWAEHHRVIPEQAAEWLALRRSHPGVAMCVAGNFNTNFGGKHHYWTKAGRQMLRNGLLGAGLACVTETERVPDGKLRYSPIDHIALSQHLAPVAAVAEAWEGTDADGMRLSDHSGLVVASTCDVQPPTFRSGLCSCR